MIGGGFGGAAEVDPEKPAGLRWRWTLVVVLNLALTLPVGLSLTSAHPGDLGAPWVLSAHPGNDRAPVPRPPRPLTIAYLPHPGERPMQGNPQVIDALNRALTIELTAINQYFVQAKMCKNWGFEKLGKKHYEESIGEMKHAEKLIDRIIFLEGVPEIARYDVIRVGINVQEQLENDLALETSGVNTYNEAITLAAQVKDNGSRELMNEILVDSEEHVDWLESQLHLIQAVGLERYLAEQISAEDDE
jgi:bacterioferritin